MKTLVEPEEKYEIDKLMEMLCRSGLTNIEKEKLISYAQGMLAMKGFIQQTGT